MRCRGAIERSLRTVRNARAQVLLSIAILSGLARLGPLWAAAEEATCFVTGVQGEVLTYRLPPDQAAKLGERSGTIKVSLNDVVKTPLKAGDTVRPGQVMWTGRAGRVQLLVGGHTLVRAMPRTLFAMRTAEAKGGKGKSNPRKNELVLLLDGAVEALTDARYLPSDTQVAVVASAKAYPSTGEPLRVSTFRARYLPPKAPPASPRQSEPPGKGKASAAPEGGDQ